MATVEHDNQAFTLDLLSQTIKSVEKSKNVIISPLSIQTCLALAFVGADGKTAEELSEGLRLGSKDKEMAIANFSQLLSRPDVNSLFKIANRIYVEKNVELKSEFNTVAADKFQSKAENIDFEKSDEAAKIINKWVEEQTNNKIQNLVEPSVLKETLVLLVNAIYFRGKWKNPFEKNCTQQKDFWNDDESSVRVDMMFVDDTFKYGELKNLDATAIQLPYDNSELYMLVIVPNKKTGLKDLEKKLKEIDLAKIESEMQREEVSLNFPKFKTEFSIELNDVLKEMGMKTMFSENANFQNLTETPVKVDQVYHKAVIEVDEIGTEAAAATYLKAVLCCLNLDVKYLTVDRPFLYFIKDPKVTFFMGRLSKF